MFCSDFLCVYFHHSTNKGGSDEDDVAAQTGGMDLPGVLWCLQHLDIVQLKTRNVQTLCSGEQFTRLFRHKAESCVNNAKRNAAQMAGKRIRATKTARHTEHVGCCITLC